MIPGHKETVRINGVSVDAHNISPTLTVPCDQAGIVIRLEQAFFHCAKAFMRSHLWRPSTKKQWPGLREFRCVKKVKESPSTSSFYWQPTDQGAVPPFLPGQYLPIELNIPGCETPIRRTYTLSSPPGLEYFRLTVKRETDGVASTYLHDSISVGSTIEVRAPAGKFVLDEASERPVVLLSAGVGLTPMIPMFQRLAEPGNNREVWFIHGAKSSLEHLLAGDIKVLAETQSRLHTHICYSAPLGSDTLGNEFDTEGRISISVLQQLLPWRDFEFYLCGSALFIEQLIEDLKQVGIAEKRIFWESFSGQQLALPVSSELKPVIGNEQVLHEQAATITFAKSNQVLQWDSRYSSLLDLAEAQGMTLPYSCRSGDCHSCSCKVLKGHVIHNTEPEMLPDEGYVLTCCAQPKGNIVLEA